MSRQKVLVASLAALVPALAGAGTDIHGHLKYGLSQERYPSDSLYREIYGQQATDQAANGRLNLQWRESAWELKADYQLAAVAGDRYQASEQQPALGLSGRVFPDDQHRLLDLTRILHGDENTALLHRLDRVHVGYAKGAWVVRAGRQAISWGNGLLFTPMDIFNPFDPAAVDKEYKNGDDLLYGQFLRANGDDLQAVWVARRDDEGKASQAAMSQALKYHGFNGRLEYDVLAARHYDENLLGLGFSTALGDWLWAGDITAADTTASGWTPSLVTSLTFSTQRHGKNLTGLVEYFYNGFGVNAGEYDQLQQAPDLLARLNRGELFNLGQHYLGASVSVEMTPLLMVSPNLFVNLGDGSVLAQLVMNWNPNQNTHVTFSFNLPIGSENSEYGGLHIDDSLPPLRVEAGAFGQLAWYF